MKRSGLSRTAAPTYGPAVTRTLARTLAREWLLTNDAGDFGCGTLAGPNTRREHGVFTAAGTRGRPAMLLLAGFEVTLEGKGSRSELSCHQFADSIHPEGFRLCSRFAGFPFPEWRYEAGGALVDYRIVMPGDRRAVVCLWGLEEAPSSGEGEGGAEGSWRLHVRPLFAYRESGALTHANDEVDMTLRGREGGGSLAPYAGCPELFMFPAVWGGDVPRGAAEVRAAPCWYYRFKHTWDAALGREGIEDLFSPCEITFEMHSGDRAALVASLEAEPVVPAAAEAVERERASALGLQGIEGDSLAMCLAQSARAFTIKGDDSLTHVRTGYPEVAGGGVRAALIALPGLFLCTGRLGEARELLCDLVRRQQALPLGAILDDVPLWLIRAGELYVDHSRDWAFLREVLEPAAGRFAGRYRSTGSERGFRMAADGLLASREMGCALTWMDAAIDGWPVLPRAGKPVEVNALWYHALGLLVRWRRRKGDGEGAEEYGRLRDLCGRSFRHRFWNAATQGLYDVVDRVTSREARAADAPSAIRPNQIFAVSLPSDLLDRHQAEGVLRLVENRLLTPVGLRTLSLEDRAFHPHYGGDEATRAAARHQGSVHPWLIGPYADAVFRVYGRTNSAYARVESCLSTLLDEHLGEGCTGQVSEVFHGASPHRPQGAFAHAPAVGELIRVYAEIKGRLW